MTKYQTHGRSRRGVVALAAIVALAACQDQNDGPLVAPGSIPALDAAEGFFSASRLDASPGDLVTIALETEAPAGMIFAGLEGALTYDARLLELVGQVADNGTMVVINASRAGEIRLQSLNVRGLGARPALFSFRVRAAGWENSLAFEASHYVTLDGANHRLRVARGAVKAAQLPPAEAGKAMDFGAWLAYLEPKLSLSDWHRPGAMLVASNGGQRNSPTGSSKWGDANGDGNVNVLDNLYTANVSVGNTAQAECIIVGGLSGDCVAVNVDPANLPGLGGPTDTCPPGVDNCTLGGRTINVLDNLRIALESVSPGSQAVAGQTIPFAPLASTTVDLCSGFKGTTRVVTGTLNLVNTERYILDTCRLNIGDEAGAAGVLNIQAGVLVEGSDSSSIVVTRNGQIFALGTFTDPIIFTCLNDGPDAPLRRAQCWGGVQIVGNAVLNEATAGTNPGIPGRSTGGGQKALEGFVPADVFYGGNNDADNSGTLRHVVVAYGGRSVAQDNELNNLTIGACGSGTTLEYIQTHAGSDDGLEIFGGRCNVKYLYSSLNDDDQFDLSFGYDGSAQFVFLRGGVDNSANLNTDLTLEWDNSETSATYNNLPRTKPVVWNMTAVSGSATQASLDKFANIRRGAGGDINNSVVVNYAIGFDIDNTESCNLVGTELTFDGLFLSVASVASGGSCDAAVATYLGSNPNFATGTVTNQFKDIFSIVNPDIRGTSPSLGSALVPQTPPNTGFFDTSATYLGAAPPTSLASGAVPFYAGWAIHAQTPTDR